MIMITMVIIHKFWDKVHLTLQSNQTSTMLLRY